MGTDTVHLSEPNWPDQLTILIGKSLLDLKSMGRLNWQFYASSNVRGTDLRDKPLFKSNECTACKNLELNMVWCVFSSKKAFCVGVFFPFVLS